MINRSPARNRVSPTGGIVAVTGRGAWMGNRGRLHRGRGTRDVVRNHQHKAWITCTLTFRNRRVAQWDPHHYTVLFFLDEAVALAAGHRPCAECRRSAYNHYRDLWRHTHGAAGVYAKDIDAQLHRERTTAQAHFDSWLDLPDGTFVATDRGPAVVTGEHLALWDLDTYGYGDTLPRPRHGTAHVLTPPSTVAILRAGYPVQISAAARDLGPANDSRAAAPGPQP